MRNPSIPLELKIRNFKLVTKDRWWLLGPMLRAGKDGRDLVYLPAVLKDACIFSLCSDPEDICLNGRYRKFFERCLQAGNSTAIYYEAFRVVVHDVNIMKAIEMLHQNGPNDAPSTYAAGIFSILAGKSKMAAKYLQAFGERHHPLNSQDARETGKEFVLELSRYNPGYTNRYGKSFLFPDCESIKTPDGAMECQIVYGGYENLCNDCYLYWCSSRVCGMI